MQLYGVNYKKDYHILEMQSSNDFIFNKTIVSKVTRTYLLIDLLTIYFL